MSSYPPVELARQISISDIPDDNKAKYYLQQMYEGNDELLWIMSIVSSFSTGHYDGPYLEFSEYIHRQWENIYKWATGVEPDKHVFNKSNRDLVRDAFLGMVVVSKWSQFKRVYRFDPELELSLGTVDEIKVPVKMLDNLPFNTLYLEFAPDGVFAPAFHGCFIMVTKYPDGLLFNIIRLTEDLRSMSGVGNFSVDWSDENPMITLKRDQINSKHDGDFILKGLHYDWEEFCFFALNALLYLCASNAEIRRVESDLKDKKGGKVKLSENLGIYECGYTFGEKIRLNRLQLESSGGSRSSSGARKSPRPHPVKASWQHYWKGSGENKERVLIFKEAYFTGGKVDVATISQVE